MNRSPKPSVPSTGTPRSSATGSSSCPGRPNASTVNWKPRPALAGWKGYTTNLTGQPASFVIDAYHQLWRIEKAFRMSKHDLQAARSTTAPASPSKLT